MHAHEAKTRALAMPYKDSDPSQQKSRKCVFRPFLNRHQKKFYMGPHYVDFAFAYDTTLIRLEMTEIWPKYVAQAFLPPLPESSAQDPPWIGLSKVLAESQF